MPLSRSLQAAQRRPGGLGPRVVPDSQPAARTLSEWSRIEAVPVGTRTEIRQAPDPVSARSPVAESPDTTQEEHGKTDQLLLKAKRQYQAACRGEDRLRKDMLDDRRFRLGRLGDESFQWPENVYIQRKQEHRAVLQTNRMPAFVALGPERRGARPARCGVCVP